MCWRQVCARPKSAVPVLVRRHSLSDREEHRGLGRTRDRVADGGGIPGLAALAQRLVKGALSFGRQSRLDQSGLMGL